ncbi:hypothetical protein [Streptomyces bauhiniae]|uniref:hypothetical protein n=1 Tax=Streptomyces bauhiniae TaxID=2340725 RepID=UPI0035DDE915
MTENAPDRRLRVLSTSDLAGIDISLSDVLATVEGAYRTLADGLSDNPRKLTVKPDDGHSVSYAMLGRDGSREVVAVKTSYKHGLDKGREEQHYYTTLTLYDDNTGLPVAMMDCSRIGSLRTPAVSALLARELAAPAAWSALVIGTGTQGRLALPFLVTALPGLEHLMVSGTHPEGLLAVESELRTHFPDRDVEVVSELHAATERPDVIIATAGGHTPAAVRPAVSKRARWPSSWATAWHHRLCLRHQAQTMTRGAAACATDADAYHYSS